MQMSDEFVSLVKEIGETRSKDEEVAIVEGEVAKLRGLCKANESTALLLQGGKKGVKADGAETARRLRELLVRLVYCEMLGQPVPFGYMLAINCTQFPRLSVKRAGFLAVSLMVSPADELNLLNTSTIRKSLESPNYLEVCMALNTLCRLVTAKTVGFFFPVVKDLLAKHQRAVVRKKAVSAVYAMMCTRPDPDDIRGVEDLFRDALCDKDPSVMVATLGVLRELLASEQARILDSNDKDHDSSSSSSSSSGGGSNNSSSKEEELKESVSKWVDLVQPLVTIQNQVIGKRLPRGYDYMGMPAPWVQMDLVELLGILGRGNARASEKMYECLESTFRAALAYKPSVAAMVVYSCIRTIMSIVPSAPLMEAASAQIGVFLRSTAPNTRYLGIRALAAALRETQGRFAQVLANDEQHQLAVIECLESDDETLRRETLDVLYLMSTPANAPVIAERLLGALRRGSHDTGAAHVRRELVAKITQLAERYAPSKQWYLDTFTAVLDAGGDLVRPDVAETLVATFDARRTVLDAAYVQAAVDTFAARVAASLAPGARPLPPLLCRVACWLLGEHGARCTGTPVPALLRTLVDLGEHHHDQPDVVAVLLVALAKLAARADPADVPPCVPLFISRYKAARRLDVAQRAHEAAALLADPATRPILAALCTPLRVDPKLPFLDAFVASALAAGAQPYCPTSIDGDDVDLVGLGDLVPAGSSAGSAQDDDDKLSFAAYPAPKDPLLSSSAVSPVPAPDMPTLAVLEPFNAAGAGAASTAPTAEPAAAPTLLSAALGTGTRKGTWTTSGFKANTPASQSPAVFRKREPEQALSSSSSSSSSSLDSVFGGATATTAAPATTTQERPAQTSPAASPARTHLTAEERRRHNAARSLFGTMSGSSSGAARSGNKTGGLFAATTAPAETAAAPARAPRNALDDLLGGFDAPAATATAAPVAPQPASSSSTSANLMDELFGAAPASAPAPVQAQAPSSSPFDSLLGGMGASTTSTATSTTTSHTESFDPPATLALDAVATNAFWTSEVRPFVDGADASLHLLAQQGSLALYGLSLARPDCAAVALVVHRAAQAQGTGERVAVHVAPQPDFALAVRAAPPATAEGTDRLALAPVPVPRTACLGVVRLARAHATLPPAPVVFAGTLTVGAGIGAGASFALPAVDARAYLRPAAYTTQRVGSVWAKHACERRVTLRAASIAQATAALERVVRAHTCSTIGSEAILCSALALPPPHDQLLVLYHCRADGKGAAVVAVRSQSAATTDAVVSLLQKDAL